MPRRFTLALGLLLPLLTLAPRARAAEPVAIRVATFNIEDLRTDELIEPYSERARHAAEVIQRIRPNVILINEITDDMSGGPDFDPKAGPGQNADRFARLLARPAAPGLAPLEFTAFSREVNTGRASGFDLDRNGEVVTIIPPPSRKQTDAQRAYGGDCWGFGAYPGEYGMVLLVDKRLEIKEDYVRTFRLFPWKDMPNAMMPQYTPEPGEDKSGTAASKEEGENKEAATKGADDKPGPWYADEAGELFRLSSKSHWDVPVELPNGEVVHFLCSHPTPPAFDGPEARNKLRNHDEIRFWADYVDNAAYIVDDHRQPGGLPAGANFVILGDLNADPDEGQTVGNPIASLLFANRHIADDPHPTSDLALPGLDPDDTSRFRLRVDYVLPSRTIGVRKTGIWRYPPAGAEFPSDHFPVWADLVVPGK
ncbi:MAG: endonuclease/exonuclease/phosphatase family protein [Phycisphaeraceae bacterium]|nr:MAG: endonuclease/exonuclease/phosphatase family protein [Phycisphaeraceae bacterium]